MRGFQIVNAREARNKFSDLIATVLTGKKVLISRFNKPVVLMTRFEDSDSDDLFSFIKRNRRKAKFLSARKIDSLVEKIINQTP